MLMTVSVGWEHGGFGGFTDISNAEQNPMAGSVIADDQERLCKSEE